MDIPQLVKILDAPEAAAALLASWKLLDPQVGRQVLVDLAEAGLTLDLLAPLAGQLAGIAEASPGSDETLLAFRDFCLASRSPLALGALFERTPAALIALCQALNLGPQFRQMLIAEPETLDHLLTSGGAPLDQAVLLEGILAELELLSDERQLAAALRRISRRERLRIVFGEVVLKHRLELVQQQLSYLSDSLLEAALVTARRLASAALRAAASKLEQATSRPAMGLVSVGLLGGAECDYAAPAKILMLSDLAGEDDAKYRAGQEFADKVGRIFHRLLSPNEDGTEAAAVVTLPAPRPSEAPPLLVLPIELATGYFVGYGRTWHRQEFLQGRAVGGNLNLGQAFLKQIEPWVYRRYLSRADETGIHSVKRRLDEALRQAQSPEEWLAVLRGTVEFLQLLWGGDRAEVRTPATLAAIAGLELSMAISVSERSSLEAAYEYFGQAVHQAQIKGGGAATVSGLSSSAEYLDRVRALRSTVEQLLMGTLTGESIVSPEAALLLDPKAGQTDIDATLAPYGLRDTAAAYHNLQSLATEPIPFLSTRRCRHSLSLIAPRLLTSISKTPDPDATLVNLLEVSNSLGAKGVLWELLGGHQPTLDLYVTVCGGSRYLTDILTRSPGMIDELVDSLQQSSVPGESQLRATLAELNRGRQDPLVALHGFKDAQHLRIGVRDILGHEKIEPIQQSLTNLAEICLGQVTQWEYTKLIEKHGQPVIGPGPQEGQPCRYSIVLLGKTAGGEPNYLSDLELLLVFEADGNSIPLKGKRITPTTTYHFFTQLAQRLAKELSALTSQGRLYPVVPSLKLGNGGGMVISLAELTAHFSSEQATALQRTSLCQARPAVGDPQFCQIVAETLSQILQQSTWQPSHLEEIVRKRAQTEEGADPLNLKRAPGGTLDIECLVQTWQLRFAAEQANLLHANTLAALAALKQAKLLDPADADYLAESYLYLRKVKSGLRLLNPQDRHTLPSDPIEQQKLAMLLRQPKGANLAEECAERMAGIRERFTRLMQGSFATLPANSRP